MNLLRRWRLRRSETWVYAVTRADGARLMRPGWRRVRPVESRPPLGKGW